MNHWPFIVAAYAATGIGTLGLVWASFARMRRAEARVEDLRREP